MLRLTSFLAATSFFLPSAIAQTPVTPKLISIPLSAVELTPGSRFEIMRDRNLDYLLNLNNSRLACLYSSAANITGTFANPTCIAYDHPQYWGHYLGHWLSATAQIYASTGNTSIRDKAADMVSYLGQIQDTWTATGDPAYDGYLYPYSIISWVNLFSEPSQNCAPVCVPFYVLHKMFAGMLDQYTLAGNQQALQIAIKIGKWVKTQVDAVFARGGQNLWQQVLGTEWGGMNDALFNLYAITNDQDMLTAAYYFNHWSWSSPLAAGVDDLAGNHANTHIPEIIGDGNGYRLTGNTTKEAILVNFFSIVNSSHSFATYGSNDHEYWSTANQLGDQLDSQTEESCTTYNILKVARHLLELTGNSGYSDFYERALFNGLLGNQNRLSPYDESTHSTGFIYMLPLGGANNKPWGSSITGFPCCWGTLSETFAKLADSIYFSSYDNTTLYISLFASSTVTWSRGSVGNVVVTQNAGFPESLTSTTSITINSIDSGASSFSIAIRVPFWAVADGNILNVNGVPVSPAPTAGSFYTITRQWQVNDRVDVFWEPFLRWETINDNRPQWSTVGAVLYGSILLAGITPTDSLTNFDPTRISDLIVRTNDDSVLNFTAPSTCGNMSMIPLMDIMFEQYAVYFHTEGGNNYGYNASGYSILPGGYNNWATTGGASVLTNGNDWNIRSGDPQEINTAILTSVVLDPTHYITGLNFSYRYVSGYGPAGQHVGTNFTLTTGDRCGTSTNGPILYQSPELTQYPFDVCNTCYSPYVNVYIPPGTLKISVTNATVFTLIFQNNDRNIQMDLPAPMTIYWSN